MSSSRNTFVLGAILAGLWAQAGCTLASPTYITSTTAATDVDAGGPGPSAPSSGSGATSGVGSDAGGTCASSDFAKPDLSQLTACGNGTGHCYDAAKVPFASQLSACPDASKVCVPNEILQAGGSKLKSCTSIIGPGGCVTATLIPEIIKQGGSALKQDVCTATQLCVPCTDPTHGNAPTPFCQPIGVMQSSCSPSSASPSGGGADAAVPPSVPCCTTNGKSNGVCIVETAVPASQRDQTKQDVCGAGDKCVPAALVAGNPVTCDGGGLGPGVCMDKCFNDLLSFAGSLGFLPTKGCGATELCIPCSLASGQGVPGCK